MTVRQHRLSPWGRVVAVSALLVYGGAAALLAGDVLSRQERVTSYAVRGSLDTVDLDLGDGDVEVIRGGERPAMTVDQIERFAYGHRAAVERSTSGGVFRLRARCPHTILRSCGVDVRLVVPDNVTLTIRTDRGDIALRDYHGSARLRTRTGNISVDGYCGNMLEIRAESGEIAASTACAPPRMSLRTTTGAVRASVPAGRYQLEADSSTGQRVVRGIDATPDAPFVLQALSTAGDIDVQGRP